jgi:hypothetical protein
MNGHVLRVSFYMSKYTYTHTHTHTHTHIYIYIYIYIYIFTYLENTVYAFGYFKKIIIF